MGTTGIHNFPIGSVVNYQGFQGIVLAYSRSQTLVLVEMEEYVAGHTGKLGMSDNYNPDRTIPETTRLCRWYCNPSHLERLESETVELIMKRYEV